MHENFNHYYYTQADYFYMNWLLDKMSSLTLYRRGVNHPLFILSPHVKREFRLLESSFSLVCPQACEFFSWVPLHAPPLFSIFFKKRISGDNDLHCKDVME